MKKIIMIAAACLFTVAGFAQKLGHIDGQQILLEMPERATLEADIQKSAKEYEDALAGMQADYDGKVKEYQANVNTWPEAISQAKGKAIQDLEKNIYEFQQTANDELGKKQEALLKPMIDKAKKAIEDVAKEQGFVYVFDTSTGALLYTGGEDVTKLVRVKLGIPADGPAKPAPAPLPKK